MIRLLPLLTLPFLIACGAVEDSSLTMNNLPSSIILYSTSEVIVCTKTFRNAQGRTQTDNNYQDFYLTSSDTAIARIVNSRQIFGVRTGGTLITAKDNNGTLISTARTLNVL
jgi:hypothetical protein